MFGIQVDRAAQQADGLVNSFSTRRCPSTHSEHIEARGGYRVAITFCWVESYRLSSEFNPAEASFPMPAMEAFPSLDAQLPSLDIGSSPIRDASSLRPDQ